MTDTLDPEPTIEEMLARLINTVAKQGEEYSTRLTDAEKRLDGIGEELSKTNERFDVIVADREKHQKRLDDRLEEIIEATQEAEKAFLVRIAKAEKRAEGFAQRNANLKRDLTNTGGTD